MAKEKKEAKLDQHDFKTKAAARAAALEVINKAHGENTAFEFASHPLPDVEAYSSGCLGLDVALGVGGYPKGRIIELWGLEASGKCLPADTYITTPNGILTVKELFEREGLEASRTSRTTEKVVPLINRHGNVEMTTHFTHNYVHPVFKTSLADGTSVKSTANHPHMIMSPSGSWVWKKTRDLDIGDQIVKYRGANTDASYVFDQDAYALGALVADGSYSTDGRISFTNNDQTVIDHVLSFMKKEGFSVKTYPRPDNNTTEFHFNSTELVASFHRKYGTELTKSAGKSIPAFIRKAGYSALRSFLSGYIDCECYVDLDKSTIEVSSASRKLLEEAHYSLLALGVNSYIREKHVKAYPDTAYWLLLISGPSFSAYNKNVGFVSQVRQEEYVDKNSGKANFDTLPNITNLLRDIYDSSETTREHANLTSDYRDDHRPTYRKLGEILELPWAESFALARLREIFSANYVYSPVTSVTLAGEEATFDFAMSETHSFIANGVVTHNTTLTLHAIAQVQKAGGSAAFIDAEHALDPKYATALGVDMDKLYFAQPESGEQALSIVETMVTSGGFDIIVVDSVAALVPQAEIDGEMGDHHVGAHARLMSQALRKLAGLVSKTNTILFFINQTRMKIGVMYGDPSTTTGGNALKFYASIRLQINKLALIKTVVGKEEEAIGSRTRVKVVKNKVAPPFREVEFDIIYGKGVSYLGDIIELAGTLGLVEKAGAWYSYKGEKIGQGSSKAAAYLEEHPEVAQELDVAIRKHYGIKPAIDRV